MDDDTLFVGEVSDISQTLAQSGYITDSRMYIGGSQHYRTELHTFEKIITLTAALVGHSGPIIVRRKDEASDSSLILSPDLEKVLTKAALNYNPKLWQGISKSTRTNLLVNAIMPKWKPLSSYKGFWQLEDQLLASCVLWTTHSGLRDATELRQLVAMLTFASALSHPDMSTQANRILKVLEDCAGETLSGACAHTVRPTRRLTEVSALYGQAYRDVSQLFNLVFCMASRSKCSEWSFFDPAAATSDTVLHLMSVLSSWLDDSFTELDNHVMKRITKARKSIIDVWKRLVKRMNELYACVCADPKSMQYLPDDLQDESIPWTGCIADDMDKDENKKYTKEQKFKALPPLPDRISAKETQRIQDALETQRVICIQGETGCGKSTLVPLIILNKAMREGRSAFIVVVQPRRIAATSLAEYVSELLGEELGEHVGYRIGGGTRVVPSKSKQCITYVTAGYLLEQIAHGHKKYFDSITHLLLDEVHERSLTMDMLCMISKLFLSTHGPDSSLEEADRIKWWKAKDDTFRKDSTRLVIMSATISADAFLRYFSSIGWTPEANMTPLHIGQKPFPVDVQYFDKFVSDFVTGNEKLPVGIKKDILSFQKSFCKKGRNPTPLTEKEAKSICQIIYTLVKEGTCILVFLPGLEEIKQLTEILQEAPVHCPCKLRVHALHSIVDKKEEDKARAVAGDTECKIILSTNIAETSVTITDVKTVIDTGLKRHMCYDKKNRIGLLKLVRCSQASAKQRMGRAGRVSAGSVLRLYSEEIFNEMRPYDEPEIYPLERSILICLRILRQYGNVYALMDMLIEPPMKSDVASALDTLVKWGALGPGPKYKVLPMGMLGTQLPLEVHHTRAIFRAVPFGCSAEVVVIIAGLTLPHPLVKKRIKLFFPDQYEFQRKSCESLGSVYRFDCGRKNDLCATLHIYEESRRHLVPGTVEHKWEKKWMKTNCISYYQLKTLYQKVDQIARLLLSSPSGLNETEFGAEDYAMLKSLVTLKKAIQFRALRDDEVHRNLQLVMASVSGVSLMAKTIQENQSNVISAAIDGATTVQCPFPKDSPADEPRMEKVLRLFSDAPLSIYAGSSGSKTASITFPKSVHEKEGLTSKFWNPTAISKAAFTLIRHAACSRRRDGKGSLFAMPDETTTITLPQPASKARMIFKCIPSIAHHYNTEETEINYRKVKLDKMSSVGGECNDDIEKDTHHIGFGFDVYSLGEKAALKVQQAFLAYLPEEPLFPILSFLLANPPIAGSQLKVSVGASLKITSLHHTSILQEDLSQYGKGFLCLSSMLALIMEINVLLLVQMVPSETRKHLHELRHEIRDYGKKHPESDNTPDLLDLTFDNHVYKRKGSLDKYDSTPMRLWSVSPLIENELKKDTKTRNLIKKLDQIVDKLFQRVNEVCPNKNTAA